MGGVPVTKVVGARLPLGVWEEESVVEEMEDVEVDGRGLGAASHDAAEVTEDDDTVQSAAVGLAAAVSLGSGPA